MVPGTYFGENWKLNPLSALAVLAQYNREELTSTRSSMWKGSGMVLIALKVNFTSVFLVIKWWFLHSKTFMNDHSNYISYKWPSCVHYSNPHGFCNVQWVPCFFAITRQGKRCQDKKLQSNYVESLLCSFSLDIPPLFQLPVRILMVFKHCSVSVLLSCPTKGEYSLSPY
jgi:hypothetical protein